MEKITEIVEQIKKIWGNLDRRARWIIVGSASLVFIGLIVIIFWMGKPRYVPMYSDLSAQDAAQIVARLEEDNIPYQLSADGSSVLVPAERVHRLRLEMAESGLPKGGVVGFEIFDQMSFGATDFERKVQYYRALGGELARTISRLEAVEMAVVQISPPEDSVFLRETRKAEASVLLKLSPLAGLKPDQIRAITNLVASSVPDLQPEDVTVVDTEGNLLNQLLDEQEELSSSHLVLSRLEIQQQFERKLENDLQRLLSRVLGPKNVAVNVSAELNLDQKEVTSTVYEPVVEDSGIVRSEEVIEEEYSGNQGSTPQGVPGTESNIPTYQEIQGEGEGGEYSREERITNYEINQRIENHAYAPGEVKRLSVAVVVNKELSPEEEENIIDLVSAAVGYSPERGDSLSISQMTFDNSLEKELAAAQQQMESSRFRQNMIFLGIGLIGLILLYLIARRFTSGFAPDVQEEKGEERGQVIDVMLGEQAAEQAATLEDFELSPEDRLRQELKEEIKDIINQKPEEVANLLKTWLLDDD